MAPDPISDPDADLTRDLTHLRRAIAISADAVAHGNHPFGALLVGADGEVLMEAENTVVTQRDVTGHAETNLVRAAWAAYDVDRLTGCTLITSCEPCAMCSGAIYWSGIGRVVFALSGPSLAAMQDPAGQHETLGIRCRTVFDAGDRPTAVAGPYVEDEAAMPHDGFWV